MIFVSSSVDHFDCFFAGDSHRANSATLAGRLAGTTEGVISARLDDDAVFEKVEFDLVNDCGEHGLCGDSSSSCLMS